MPLPSSSTRAPPPPRDPLAIIVDIETHLKLLANAYKSRDNDRVFITRVAISSLLALLIEAR